MLNIAHIATLSVFADVFMGQSTECSVAGVVSVTQLSEVEIFLHVFRAVTSKKNTRKLLTKQTDSTVNNFSNYSTGIISLADQSHGLADNSGTSNSQRTTVGGFFLLSQSQHFSFTTFALHNINPLSLSLTVAHNNTDHIKSFHMLHISAT